jgi:hypothetical protein
LRFLSQLLFTQRQQVNHRGQMHDRTVPQQRQQMLLKGAALGHARVPD